MIIETRGNPITFTQSFYDSDNNLTSVETATLTLIYPSSEAGSALLSRDPGQLKAKETVAMDNTSEVWSATWDSSVADPGIVYWNIASTNPVFVKKGMIVLRGNLANLEAF